jgi:5,10-methylenetetrahydrofolate reductase
MESRKRLKSSLSAKSGFVVVAELVGEPGYKFGPIEKFLSVHKASSGSDIPAGFDFVGITSPQNPGGVANIEPMDVLGRIDSADLLGELDFMPHIGCKDHNTDAIVSSLVCFKARGVDSVLALTGDKPTEAQGVFEIESIGLLNLIKRMNYESYIKARPEQLADIHQFYAGAAVSPFKYTEASQMQQYYKMEKKIACGAQFLITQLGWDWAKSLEMMRYLEENGLHIPVLGNVYLLSTTTPAPRLMHDIKLPGCFVSDELYEKVCSESLTEHIERAAQQVAMYKSIGAAGVDIGGAHSYDTFTKILNLAAEIGDDWEKHKDNLCWPGGEGFYLYDKAGRRVSLSKPKKKFGQRFFNFTHRAILDSDYRGFHVFRKLMAWMGTEKGTGFIYKAFNAAEKSGKYLLFDCEECGDCFLPENFGLCTIGGCEKGLDNAPCGDATVDGYCGNDLERVCIGERIYEAAAAETDGIQQLRKTINKPRNPALAHTSSILNYLFGKDHTMKNALISIGESIHASIPKVGKIMKQLCELGPNAYTEPSGALDYIKALVESQADEGADYIAVNVDAFGEDDPAIAVKLMTEYVRLVRKWGRGVPVCIDSSDDNVLIAGMKEWYNTAEDVKAPLINSIKVYTADAMMPLKAEYDFAFVGLLVTEDKASGPGGSHSVDELFGLTKQLYDKAVNGYGFGPGEIFFDSTVFPLAIDMPMEPDVPGYTYRAFETIKRIKNDPKLKKTHCSLGISNCCRDLPGRRVGICRAYVAKAMEYGLDAGIVNVAHHYGQVPADPGLYELVSAFADMDGSAERSAEAMRLMSRFCVVNRKPVK